MEHEIKCDMDSLIKNQKIDAGEKSSIKYVLNKIYSFFKNSRETGQNTHVKKSGSGVGECHVEIKSTKDDIKSPKYILSNMNHPDFTAKFNSLTKCLTPITSDEFTEISESNTLYIDTFNIDTFNMYDNKSKVLLDHILKIALEYNYIYVFLYSSADLIQYYKDLEFKTQKCIDSDGKEDTFLYAKIQNVLGKLKTINNKPDVDGSKSTIYYQKYLKYKQKYLKLKHYRSISA